MRFRALLASAVSAGLCCATPAHAENLHDVLTVVYDTNPTIRAERKRFRAVSEANDQAWAAALPQITADASYSFVDQEQIVNSTLFGMTTETERAFQLDSESYAVRGEQPIFAGLRHFNAIKQANARVRAGAAQLIAAEQQVLREAVAAYFDIVRDMSVYNANVSNVEVLLGQLRDAQVRFELGDVTRTDVSQAEARLAGARAQLAGAKTQLATSRARFKELVGFLPGTLDADPPLPELPETVEEAHAYAQKNAPQVIVVREEEEASRRQYHIENSRLLPTISLTASYLHAYEPSSFVEEDEQFAYGVRATLPLFQGGLRLSRSREAKALNERDQSRIVATSREIETVVTSAWERLYEARSRIRSARAQVDANELALQGVRREAQLGARTTLDVLNAEQEFLNSTVELAAAKRDAQVAAYSLLAAIGALSVDSTLTGTSDRAESGEAQDPAAQSERVAEAPAATPTAASVSPSPQPADNALSGTHVVQIGAFRSDQEAQAQWGRLQSKLGNYLGGKFYDIKRADLGDRGVYHRLRVGPFFSSDDAQEYCAGLKERGEDCLTDSI